ncbi:uncharacterized protein LOC134210007 [Armigeres subalbatus]|uniref:uncharacterized protein LOC134210007 n=1 Tax=Armigeres subalbatus TaxID=124917 RepID=UPI002ED1FFC9
MGRIYCAVNGCVSMKDGVSSLSFFKIFSGNRTVQGWVEFCNNSCLSKHSVICSKHFRESDFVNPQNKSQGLHSFARPSLMPCEEDAVLDISMDLDEDLLRTDPNLQSEDVGYCVEIGASQDVNVPLSNTQRQNNSFETDHEYCCKVDNITKMMDQLILKE